MNARVLLLVLVSALFMAAWNGDQQAMSQAYARQERAREARLAGTLMTAPAGDTQHVTTSLRNQPPAAHRGSVASTLPFALPSGIVAGNYLAVNHSGLTLPVTVDADADVKGSGTPRDLYLVDDASGHRWYLVRLQAGQ